MAPRLFAAAALLAAAAAAATAEAASSTYNFLAIGDWGNDSPGQYATAKGMGSAAPCPPPAARRAPRTAHRSACPRRRRRLQPGRRGPRGQVRGGARRQ